MSARVGGALALAALLALPPLMSKYHLEILISVLFWAYLGIAWNVLGGYAGQFSFGHAAFFGIGAYTSTLLLLRAGLTPWIGMGRFSRLTRPFNALGLPVLSVPCGFSSSGLPLSVQLAGRPFDEASVLRLGHAYEQASPWHMRGPTPDGG